MKNSLDIISVSPLDKPVETTVKVPGSKSYSLRALLISTLCENKFEIKNLLDSEDTVAMQNCLMALKNNDTKLDANESGLTARFMTALACISPGVQTITGAASLQKRPIKDLVDALRQLGANIEYLGKDGFLPLKIISSEPTEYKVTLKGDVSSQYLSALMLIAPKLEKGLVIEVKGKQISKPYIDMTIDIMGYFGVKVKNDNYQRYEIKPQKYQAKDYEVEDDYSSAAYFFAINALTNSKTKVKGLNPDSKQGDKKFVDLLTGGKLPANINAEDFPDQAMTLAALAAFTEGVTTIDGIASLRIKETERVVAVQNELAKMGIETSATKDSLTILGGKPKNALINPYGDHRIAMSFAVAGTKIPGMRIMNPAVVNKTFPGFWDELAKIATVKRTSKSFSNILLIGMRGGGKTTVGRILAQRLKMDFIDMDLYLEKKHGQKVRDIVLENGWEHFRKLETAACRQLSKHTNSVISSGGGIVLDQANVELFKPDSISILLKADAGILSQRIRTDKNRPELSTQPSLLGELDEVWEKRKDKYYRNADFIIDTSAISPNQAIDEIMEKLEIA